MSERTDKFSEALDQLISQGEKLKHSIAYEFDKDGYDDQLAEALDGDEAKIKKWHELNVLPFKEYYQAWYSQAQALVKQVLPDRLADFNSHYEFSRVRKDISFQNYMVRDYLQGLRMTRDFGRVVVADGSAAIPEFVQQLNIVKAARAALSSALMDLKGVLQADLFDSEVETAKALAKAGYLRAAGAICGVVMEKHLLHVCGEHKIAVKKKNPGISDLSQLLRNEDVTTVPQWRFIQHLADIRNLCDHAKGKEPTKDEIDDLVTGTEKVLKTIF